MEKPRIIDKETNKKYSNYTMKQIIKDNTIFGSIAEKLLDLVEDSEIKEKMERNIVQWWI